jgi:hypothetical protein
MISRLVILAILFLSLTFVFISCSDNSVTSTGTNYTLDTASFTYPFKDGSTWNYNRKYTAYNFRPDSVRKFFNNLPLYANGTTTILYDTVINGITTKCFFTSYTENSSLFESREYYGNYDSGLLCYGGSSFGTEFTPYSVSGIFYTSCGYRFNSVKQLFRAFENSRMSFNANDSVILEIPPVLCLKYPIITGSEWLFKNVMWLGEINKKYLGFENITCSGSLYTCMKTQKIWISMPELVFYDYYSKSGILKRDYTIKDLIISNEFGDTLGFADLNDLYTVTSFNIPSE